MKSEFDVILGPGKFFRTIQGVGQQARRNTINLIMREKRVFHDAFFFTFANHDVRGIMQHPLDEHATRECHDHRGVRLVPHE